MLSSQPFPAVSTRIRIKNNEACTVCMCITNAPFFVHVQINIFLHIWETPPNRLYFVVVQFHYPHDRLSLLQKQITGNLSPLPTLKDTYYDCSNKSWESRGHGLILPTLWAINVKPARSSSHLWKDEEIKQERSRCEVAASLPWEFDRPFSDKWKDAAFRLSQYSSLVHFQEAEALGRLGCTFWMGSSNMEFARERTAVYVMLRPILHHAYLQASVLDAARQETFAEMLRRWCLRTSDCIIETINLFFSSVREVDCTAKSVSISAYQAHFHPFSCPGFYLFDDGCKQHFSLLSFSST